MYLRNYQITYLHDRDVLSQVVQLQGLNEEISLLIHQWKYERSYKLDSKLVRYAL